MKRYITVRLLSSVAAIAHLISSRGSINVATMDDVTKIAHNKGGRRCYGRGRDK